VRWCDGDGDDDRSWHTPEAGHRHHAGIGGGSSDDRTLIARRRDTVELHLGFDQFDKGRRHTSSKCSRISLEEGILLAFSQRADHR